MIRRLVGGAAVAGIAIFGGAGVFDDDTTRNDQGDIVESGGVGVLSIQKGDCLQIPDEDTVVSLEGVPCDTPTIRKPSKHLTLSAIPHTQPMSRWKRTPLKAAKLHLPDLSAHRSRTPSSTSPTCHQQQRDGTQATTRSSA